MESSRPGELLCKDTFYVGHLKGVGRVYMHVVVDSLSSYALGFLHTSKRPEAAVAVLHNDVLPFYCQKGLPIAAVLTDNGREFCGTDAHPYELYLDLNEIEHRRTRVRTPRKMALWSASTGRRWMNSSARRSGQRFTRPWRLSRKTWIAG